MNKSLAEQVLAEEGCAVCSGKITAEEMQKNIAETKDKGYVKVHVTTDRGGENLWAIPTDRPNEFEVNNTPFFTSAFGCGDIVQAYKTGQGQYEFDHVVRRVSETHTVQYAVEFDDEEMKKRYHTLAEELIAAGYKPEGMVLGIMSVGVPYGEGTDNLQKVLDASAAGLNVTISEK
jgi:hypothetical protein